jgi:hypothetical protein
MHSKLLSAEGSTVVSLPSDSVRRVPEKENVKSFVIALLLLVVAFLTFVAAMLAHYPQKADAFLNSDEPLHSKHVVTSNK